MRWLVAVIVLAGCAGTPDDSDGGPDGPDGPMVLDGPYWGSHPAYGFPTYGMLFDGMPETWTPVPPRDLPGSFGLGSLEHVAHVSGVSGGAGIAVFGHHAYVGPAGGPIHVVDISEPAAASVVATVDAANRDAETIAYPDGRLVLVTTGGGGTVYVTDITDPTQPTVLTTIEMAHTSHNLAVVPGTPILYNSPSGGGATDIWDLSDPTAPVLALDWENGQGCHDIMWYINNTSQTYRGYCAGLGVTQIWDVTDPLSPQVITEIGLPESTPLSISHLAMVNHDASILIVGDETGGGALPACDYYLNTPVTGTMSGPSGNLWFYDLSDETAPVYMSRLSVNAFDAVGTCTSHFGRILEDRDHLVMAYYGAGVILVDFTELLDPVIVDQWRPISVDPAPPGLTWDAWYYQGYVFTGDITRGMDVLALGPGLI